jgi:hypothetical protein
MRVEPERIVRMAADPESTGWIPQLMAGLGLGSSALGAMVIRSATRLSRVEQEVTDMRKRNDADHAEMKKGLGKVIKHITGTDL